jgi:hypothetical protein
MDKEFGRQQNSTWSGVKIRYERDEVQFETEETDGESDIALSDL